MSDSADDLLALLEGDELLLRAMADEGGLPVFIGDKINPQQISLDGWSVGRASIGGADYEARWTKRHAEAETPTVCIVEVKVEDLPVDLDLAKPGEQAHRFDVFAAAVVNEKNPDPDHAEIRVRRSGMASLASEKPNPKYKKDFLRRAIVDALSVRKKF